MTTAPTTSPEQFITAVVHGTEIRADTDSPVPWWSYGKTVLAGAALALVAQGRLHPDELVRGKPFTLRQLLGHRAVFEPLGISGVVVAQEPADLDTTAWGNARGYHPGWVYHGLLVGPPVAAVLFLHRLLAGQLLPPDLLAAMRDAYPVGGVIPGRPWTTAGYGLGLMIGQGLPAGEYVGHTGGGPGSTSAVYQRAGPPIGTSTRRTAAAFATLDEPGPVEARATTLAAGPPP